MKILYFGKVREALGRGEEELEAPRGVKTVGELADWLRQRSERHKAALVKDETLRAAVNQEHASMETAIANAEEVAFFPPMTGG